MKVARCSPCSSTTFRLFTASLKESSSSSYIQRTEWNVRDTDATVVLSIAATLSGGSKKTLDLARKHRKPYLHIHAGQTNAADRLRTFLAENVIHTLHVAGPRRSKEPSVAQFVVETLDRVLEPAIGPRINCLWNGTTVWQGAVLARFRDSRWSLDYADGMNVADIPNPAPARSSCRPSFRTICFPSCQSCRRARSHSRCSATCRRSTTGSRL